MLILYIIIEHCTYYISGDVENAVEHLSNAVPLCGQPQQLLQVLEQTLPPQVFQLLVQKLPEVNKVICFTVEAFIEKWCEPWCPSHQHFLTYVLAMTLTERNITDTNFFLSALCIHVCLFNGNAVICTRCLKRANPHFSWRWCWMKS